MSSTTVGEVRHSRSKVTELSLTRSVLFSSFFSSIREQVESNVSKGSCRLGIKSSDSHIPFRELFVQYLIGG
jgi:hypothetical protein